MLKHWLSHGRLDDICYEAEDVLEIRMPCDAYAAGRLINVAPRFQDEVMDCIINAVVEDNGRSIEDVQEVNRTLKTGFAAKSVGREFLVDWLIYGKMPRAEKEGG